MISVIILDNGEPSVIKYTYQCLFKELKDIHGSELLISKDWFETLPDVHNNYICLVEADCVVSPGYFEKQLKSLINSPLRKISMLSPVVAVSHWDNCFYGYRISGELTDSIIPVSKKKSSALYPIQVGYVPGALIRTKMLKEAILELGINKTWNNDLVFLSTQLSMAFWQQGLGGAKGQNGNPVYLNPTVTYVTTEDYVNDIGRFDIQSIDLMSKFSKESI